MNIFNKDFQTIEEGEKLLAKVRATRDQMGGALYWNVVNADMLEIEQKLNMMKIDKEINK